MSILTSNLKFQNEERKKKRQQLKIDREREETHKCIFKPNVCNRTKKIMRRKGEKGEARNVFERNYDFEFERLEKIHNRIEQLNMENRTPNITPRAANIKREQDVGDRLYSLAMQSIAKKQQATVSLE